MAGLLVLSTLFSSPVPSRLVHARPVMFRLRRAPLPLRVASLRAAFSSRPPTPGSSDISTTANAILNLVAADNGGGGLEADLDRLDPPLSDAVVSATLRALTDRGVPAHRFFDWLSLRGLGGFSPSARAHNLLVDNAGRLADYPAMARALARVSARRLSLKDRAFAFLKDSASSSSRSGVSGAVRAILRALDSAGGPCRASGVFALVKALASIGKFEEAVLVIQETAAMRRTAYYNALMAAKCRTGDFEGARELFDEMREASCGPNANTWNYLLGCLLKHGRAAEACALVESMERSEPDDVPNPLTYEILTCHACRAGKMDSARRILDQMSLEGLTPRITIHTAFIKGYLNSGRVEDACAYVRAMSARDRHSVNRNYSLLANLLRKSGRIVDAGRVLYELMEKGLKPDHSAYARVAKDLHKMGRGDLAAQLKSLFHRFTVHGALER